MSLSLAPTIAALPSPGELAGGDSSVSVDGMLSFALLFQACCGASAVPRTTDSEMAVSTYDVARCECDVPQLIAEGEFESEQPDAPTEQPAGTTAASPFLPGRGETAMDDRARDTELPDVASDPLDLPVLMPMIGAIPWSDPARPKLTSVTEPAEHWVTNAGPSSEHQVAINVGEVVRAAPPLAATTPLKVSIGKPDTQRPEPPVSTPVLVRSDGLTRTGSGEPALPAIDSDDGRADERLSMPRRPVFSHPFPAGKVDQNDDAPTSPSVPSQPQRSSRDIAEARLSVPPRQTTETSPASASPSRLDFLASPDNTDSLPTTPNRPISQRHAIEAGPPPRLRVDGTSADEKLTPIETPPSASVADLAKRGSRVDIAPKPAAELTQLVSTDVQPSENVVQTANATAEDPAPLSTQTPVKRTPPLSKLPASTADASGVGNETPLRKGVLKAEVNSAVQDVKSFVLSSAIGVRAILRQPPSLEAFVEVGPDAVAIAATATEFTTSRELPSSTRATSMESNATTPGATTEMSPASFWESRSAVTTTAPLPRTTVSSPYSRVETDLATRLPQPSDDVITSSVDTQATMTVDGPLSPLMSSQRPQPFELGDTSQSGEQGRRPRDDSTPSTIDAAHVRDAARSAAIRESSPASAAPRTPAASLADVILDAVRDITPALRDAESDVVRVEINPPSHGPLTVELERTSSGLSVRVTVVMAETHALLADGRTELIEALGQLHGGEVSLDLTHSSGFGTADGDRRSQHDLASDELTRAHRATPRPAAVTRTQHDLDRLA